MSLMLPTGPSLLAKHTASVARRTICISAKASPSSPGRTMTPALDISLPSARLHYQTRLNSTTTETTGPAGKIKAAQDPMTGETLGSTRPLDATALIIEKTASGKKPPPSHELIFGHSFSDHMLTVDWSSSKGWSSPKIQPYGPFTLDPSSVIFHYAPSLFEGMKAYKDVNGEVRLFRPDMNMKRMNTSAERLALPNFSHGDLIKLIATLVDLDSAWIPSEPGHSLYIRPALIGTQAALGVHPTTDARLFVISSPVGPYYKTGFKPVALEADPSKVRAWPGGTGNYKLGGNYAPGIRPQMEAATRGYQQNLWLFGDEHWLTEVGTMNLFVALKQKDGSELQARCTVAGSVPIVPWRCANEPAIAPIASGVELVTPPLNGMILPGVTRDSILGLAREHSTGSTQPLEGVAKELKVSEREINMAEIQKASSEGALLEIFGAGTAAVVSPVDRIGYLGKDVHVPVGPSGAGPIAKAMLERISDIQLGKVEHPWSVRVKDIVDQKV